MTSATTILAPLPVLTATCSCADVMVPMAIPSVGGLLVLSGSVFIVPRLYFMFKALRFSFLYLDATLV